MNGLGLKGAAVTAGACHNYSLEWLSFMFKGTAKTPDGLYSDAAKRMAELKKYRGASVTQRVFVQGWSESAITADRGLAKMRGMSIVNEPIPYGTYSQSKLVAETLKPDPGAMLYSYWFTGSVVGAAGGAHTIAFFRRQTLIGRNADNIIYAFDPNFGEYELVEGMRDQFFTFLFGQYGPMGSDWMRTLRN